MGFSIDMKRDYKFIAYSFLQGLNAILLLFVAVGIMFWHGDKQVKDALKSYEDKSNMILTNSLNVVSNAYLLLSFKLNQGDVPFISNDKGSSEDVIKPTSSEVRAINERREMLSPSAISLCTYRGQSYCRINGLEHWFALGDYWLDKSPIVEITDYYVRTEQDIYFLKEKGRKHDGHANADI